LGQGFFFYNPGPGVQTITFVGEVGQGALSVPITGNQNIDLVGNPVPISGGVSTVLAGYAPTVDVGPTDFVYKWDGNALGGAGDLNPDVATWFNSTSEWRGVNNLPSTLSFFSGEALLLGRIGGPTTWVRNFTVQ
jgi:hypothetical protein